MKSHGLYKHPLYKVYQAIIDRCFNTNCKSYHHYGGRGITMCREWREDVSKFIVWGELNGYRTGLSIERSNNDGNYEPDNCKFVTMAEQHRNTRQTLKFTIDGVTNIAKVWAKIYSIGYPTLIARLSKGMPIKEALTTNLQRGRRTDLTPIKVETETVTPPKP